MRTRPPVAFRRFSFNSGPPCRGVDHRQRPNSIWTDAQPRKPHLGRFRGRFLVRVPQTPRSLLGAAAAAIGAAAAPQPGRLGEVGVLNLDFLGRFSTLMFLSLATPTKGTPGTPMCKRMRNPVLPAPGANFGPKLPGPSAEAVCGRMLVRSHQACGQNQLRKPCPATYGREVSVPSFQSRFSPGVGRKACPNCAEGHYPTALKLNMNVEEYYFRDPGRDRPKTIDVQGKW